MITDLLNSWEETYKKGQLTLWIFISLKDGNKYVGEIKSFIENMSNNTISREQQSVYRSLIKYLHLEIVEFNSTLNTIVFVLTFIRDYSIIYWVDSLDSPYINEVKK